MKHFIKSNKFSFGLYLIFLTIEVSIFAENFSPGIPKSFIKQFLSENPIILEAGSFNGNDTLGMVKIWPHATIYAFEPIPKWFKETKKRTEPLFQVKCYQEALSDKCGEAQFFVSSNKGMSSSLLEPAKHLDYFPNVKFEDFVTVKTITLDAWAKREGVKHIDFIWLDLQGSEPAVLMASPKILKTVKVVYSEISREELYKGQIVYADFKKFMQKQGFKEIYEDTAWVHGNALFVRSNKDKVVLFKKDKK